MNKALRYITLIAIMALHAGLCQAQRFFNLTADEVRITPSLQPLLSYTVPLQGNYRDSTYTASLLYPEFVDMTQADIENYLSQPDADSVAMPVIDQRIVLSRKQPALQMKFSPVVLREGRYQLLVSFMLKVESKPKASKPSLAPKRAATPTERYAAHSVLQSGKWAKISVSQTGVHQLTEALIREAGFSNINKVKIYGNGGNLIDEVLSEESLIANDDLQEVPTCTVGGRRLFYAKGSVSWSSNAATRRTRNPYSDKGYYFLTESDTEEPLSVDTAAFMASFYPSADDYHTLYENDGYAWYHGGRNLYDTQTTVVGSPRTILLENNPNATSGTLSVCVSAAERSYVSISFNGKSLGSIRITGSSTYDMASETTLTQQVSNLAPTDTITLTVTSGGPVRLDFVSMAWDNPSSAPDLEAGTFPTPQYVYGITNQDHHADPQADMVIIIPTSQKLLTQAQRLKTFHEEHDSLRVNIVPADELYNEFSSGTPDASAYRHYMKMLYDRAETDADMPRYLLMFGDCVWDNRMITSDCKSLVADDYLLCYESENSFNTIKCYVDDGFYCYLDDNEGSKPLMVDKLDVAVGRFPVTSEAEAKIMVDKTIGYVENENAGDWQNTLMFLGDDGDDNGHMNDANQAAEQTISEHPGFLVKKVMWDSYTRESSSTGYSYPEVTRIVKQQQAAGALVMDYAGHGREDQMSHESVLRLSDFAQFTNTNLPLWITASCDIMPFDGTSSTIGETCVLNEKGGSFAFYGTTRTVYETYNTRMNKNFLHYALSTDASTGKPMTLGEAQRRAKNTVSTTNSSNPLNDEVVNNLQYSLLGDPAVALCLPTYKIVIDTINGIDLSADGATVTMKAGATVNVRGHIEGAADYNGLVSLTVRDNKETIVCRLNDTSAADVAFTYTDRQKTIFSGSDNISGGRFSISFAVPKDINYSNETGLINVFAFGDTSKRTAHGYNEQFTVGGSDIQANDSIGPSIYCYLNSPSFSNGDEVNPTPYFHAELSDKDGLNTSGSGIGHDLQLIIDGEMARTYNLNDNFAYDFGSYTSGSTYYNIPELDEGEHKLQFRAWDILNNVSVAELKFKVVRGQAPTITVSCTDNPATTSTSFIVGHNRLGSDLDVLIEVFDMSGRLLWNHQDTGVNSNEAYTYTWNLSTDSGATLQTGVYLYRVSVSSDGSKQTTKAKKLIVIGNK